MKTLDPHVLTARIAEHDLAPFDDLRRRHFPAERNFLRAHLTMYHRLPGERLARIVSTIEQSAKGLAPLAAETTGIRHLGAGVAFIVGSPDLLRLHENLRAGFRPWLGGQDMQRWQPHITVQNKVSRNAADHLHRALSKDFRPQPLKIEGLDLWKYLGGPWQLERTIRFEVASAAP